MSLSLRHAPVRRAFAGLSLAAGLAGAQVLHRDGGDLATLAVETPRAAPTPVEELLGERRSALEPAVADAWGAFASDAGGTWVAYVDPRNGHLSYAEGSGLPWIPGRGNSLRSDDVDAPLGASGEATLSTMETLARRFAARYGAMLGVDPSELRLSAGRSGNLESYLWFVDFDVVRGGLPIEGARVVFRVNHGNLIQLGTENLPRPGLAPPAARLSRDDAFRAFAAYVPNFDSAYDSLIDPGSLHLLPVVPAAEQIGLASPFGDGLDLLLVWEFSFRRDGVEGTWRARVDAATGEIVAFDDVNEYAIATVTGGVRKTDGLPADVILPMPFANLSIGGFTNSAGLYNWPGGAVTSSLQGQYVTITDTCGAISGASDGSGNIAFGTSGGTDCTTPGTGGAGNTHSTRTQFYQVDRAKEIGRGWLPANAWLNGVLNVRVNLNQTCNAYWDGTRLNFFHKGAGVCANTGELPGVSLHEWGHGLDQNDGNGSAPENGTGETYGDWSATLFTHASCVGSGFLPGNCGGYGDACTSCSGVRDIDWAKHTSNAPHTVANFTQPLCPPPGVSNPNYVGPCGQDVINHGGGRTSRREGHCESYISSEGLWDFAARDLPSPGSGAAWSIVDRLWYLSRSTATSAFVCDTTVNPWTSNACATGTTWRVFRAIDDDDGNLANGTPHSCNLFAALNRHGIACPSDPGANVCFNGCTPPSSPTLSVSQGGNSVLLTWTSSGAGISYDVYRSELSCSAGFIRIASGLTTTTYTDNAVANGYTYDYQVIAYPTGSLACASAPSACVNIDPTCPAISSVTGPAATATFPNHIAVTWNDSASAVAATYGVYRGTTSGGPYSLVGTVNDSSPGVGGSGTYNFDDGTVSGGTTYFYVIRAANAGGCSSANSTEVSALATGDCLLAPVFAGLQSVAALGGGEGCGVRLSWNPATPGCGNALTYSIYRSSTAGFTPGPANLLATCLSGTAYDDATMPLDTMAYYVVRAEDGSDAGGGACNGGNTDANVVQQGAYVPSTVNATRYSNDFQTSSADWVAVNFGGADFWRGIQNCPAGTSIFRFGGTTCANLYGASAFFGREPASGAGVPIPTGSTTTQLAFQHRFQLQGTAITRNDGGTVGVALDGSTNYTIVPAAAITAGPAYLGTLNSGTDPAGSAGINVWSGTSTNFATNVMQSTTINLDSVCNTITGGSAGCAGHAVHIAWIAVTDSATNMLGWFLDNVAVTVTPGAACTAAPNPVQVVTATGKNQQVTVEWVNPASGPFASTRVRTSTASYPADPGAGTLVGDVAGTSGNKSSVVHAAGAGSNGVQQFYSAFANNGASVFSARKIVSGLPLDTTTNSKWTFSTPASALAPPIQGWGIAVFVPGNDRFLHAMQVGAAGGTWPAPWKPAAMNAPAQEQPLVLPAVYTGLPHDAVFAGSQDGFIYCFNATTGAGCTGWPAGGRSAAGFGLVQTSPMLDPATRLLLFGTRNGSGANSFDAVNVANGTTAWSFTNAIAQGGDGQAMGIVSSPTLILGTRLFFSGRTRFGGSSNSVWALDFNGAGATLAWARQVGDVDAAVTQDWTANHLIVGTNGGAVYALAPANGATVWTRSFGDGAVKSFVYYDPDLSRFDFATATKVWSILASGATGSDWTVTLNSPTRPLKYAGTTRAYVGACADAGCTNGRLVELDSANSWTVPKNFDFAGAGGLGPVTIDRTNALAHAGSRAGRVVAVAVPLP